MNISPHRQYTAPQTARIMSGNSIGNASLESRESNNRKNTAGINSIGVRAAGGKPKKVDATLGINYKTKKMLKSPTISNKKSIISMNKRAIENMSEMNKQIKINSKKSPQTRQRKSILDNAQVSPIAHVNFVMNNG